MGRQTGSTTRRMNVGKNNPTELYYMANAPEGQKYQEYSGGQFYVANQPPEGMSPDEVESRMTYDGSSWITEKSISKTFLSKQPEKEVGSIQYGEEDKGGKKFKTRTDKVEGGRFRKFTPFTKPGELSRSQYNPETGKEVTSGVTYDEKGQKGLYVKYGKLIPTLGGSSRGGTTTQELSLTKQLFLDKLKEIV
jgi:hypothetical protein